MVGPTPVIDGLGYVVGLPTKLALLDCRADNHDVSAATETALLRYLDRNQLNNSLVRINQYDPCGEWRRLVANKEYCAGWRFTGGMYSFLKYTLLPGRIMGGDWYNPYTNTTHVYSDIAPLVISRAAYAKDVRCREHPGAYATTQVLPIVKMISETLARQEALAYSDRHSDEIDPEEARRILAPDYGSSWGGQIGAFVPYGSQLGRLAGAAVGHAANFARTKTLPEWSKGEQAKSPASGCAVACDALIE